MAVSQQWFVQWSSPPMMFTDINNRFNSVNDWSTEPPQWSWNVGVEHSGLSVRKNRTKFDGPLNNYYNGMQGVDPAPVNESPPVAGLAIFLTMMGLARSQSVPADMETPPFNTLYKWKQIGFEYSTQMQRRRAILERSFIPENNLPLGLEVWGSRVFVTIPRWKKGVPATLATVSRSGGVTSPPLKPYPNWAMNTYPRNGPNCAGLISVFRISVDPCGKLWVLDSGQTDSVKNSKQVCPPSILVFDLATDQLLARYVIPKKFVLQDSLYTNIVIDSRTSDCSDLHAYMADTWRFGLLVFRQHDEHFWRFSHPFFFPDPLASNFTLQGLNFQWTDGIFGLALSPIDQFSERILFFHPMSSLREFYVSTSVLRDPLRVSNSSSEFSLAGTTRGPSSQASASAIDNRGVMFYGLVLQDSVGCWDTNKAFTRENNRIVALNSETLVFPNDVKIDQEQNVWVISNRLPMFQNAPLNPDDYNYRIMYASATEAVRGTICEPVIGTYKEHR
ncbi:L-dopachrome tautomerase yellow-f-like [Amyelois transitella]|uniref:L-dopachrome tautomerase yellow-f-like n=1 Tax=Amyelois transitella TaxID=680683 RepID=UPI00298F4747|nr:L-dopachrome tautomerase yellow-f-like [Amyelois transitella]